MTWGYFKGKWGWFCEPCQQDVTDVSHFFSADHRQNLDNQGDCWPDPQSWFAPGNLWYLTGGKEVTTYGDTIPRVSWPGWQPGAKLTPPCGATAESMGGRAVYYDQGWDDVPISYPYIGSHHNYTASGRVVADLDKVRRPDVGWNAWKDEDRQRSAETTAAAAMTALQRFCPPGLDHAVLCALPTSAHLPDPGAGDGPLLSAAKQETDAARSPAEAAARHVQSVFSKPWWLRPCSRRCPTGPIPGAQPLPDHWGSQLQDYGNVLAKVYKAEHQAKFEPLDDGTSGTRDGLQRKGSCAVDVEVHKCPREDTGRLHHIILDFHLQSLVGDADADYVYPLLVWPRWYTVEWTVQDVEAGVQLVVSRQGPSLDPVAEVTVVWPPEPGGRPGGKGSGKRSAKQGPDGASKGGKQLPAGETRWPSNCALVHYRPSSHGPFHRENSTATHPEPAWLPWHRVDRAASDVQYWRVWAALQEIFLLRSSFEQIQGITLSVLAFLLAFRTDTRQTSRRPIVSKFWLSPVRPRGSRQPTPRASPSRTRTASRTRWGCFPVPSSPTKAWTAATGTSSNLPAQSPPKGCATKRPTDST